MSGSGGKKGGGGHRPQLGHIPSDKKCLDTRVLLLPCAAIIYSTHERRSSVADQVDTVHLLKTTPLQGAAPTRDTHITPVIPARRDVQRCIALPIADIFDLAGGTAVVLSNNTTEEEQNDDSSGKNALPHHGRSPLLLCRPAGHAWPFGAPCSEVNVALNSSEMDC